MQAVTLRSSAVRRAGLGLGLALLLAGVYWFGRDPAPARSVPPEPPAADTAASASPGLPAHPGPLASPGAATPPGSQVAAQLLREAEDRLASYRRYARYPPGSRPAHEHPGEMTPFAPVVRSQPLYFKGQANDEVRVSLGQDRRELVADEVVRLWLRCEDSQGKALPCQVPQATVMMAPPSEGKVPPSATRFADDGLGGDERAGDGTLTAAVQPSALGFGGYHGPVRVQLAIALGAEQGESFFDVMYTPEEPARFTGKVAESLTEGSLVLALGIQVKRPGRYFVIGRVDDEHGKQLGYLQWDGELAIGQKTVPLTVFGKLVHDARPELPLYLRDVEGFLFLDDSAPDRLHLPRLAGVVHKTRVYSLADFSDREWQSEQKQRYLDEYQKDLDRAKVE